MDKNTEQINKNMKVIGDSLQGLSYQITDIYSTQDELKKVIEEIKTISITLPNTSSNGGNGTVVDVDNIYTADGTLTGTRTMDLDGNKLLFTGIGEIVASITSPVNGKTNILEISDDLMGEGASGVIIGNMSAAHGNIITTGDLTNLGLGEDSILIGSFSFGGGTSTASMSMSVDRVTGRTASSLNSFVDSGGTGEAYQAFDVSTIEGDALRNVYVNTNDGLARMESNIHTDIGDALYQLRTSSKTGSAVTTITSKTAIISPNPATVELYSVHDTKESHLILGNETLSLFNGNTSTGYTLPLEDGTAGQVLSTDGSGTATWTTSPGGGSSVYSADGLLTGNRKLDGDGYNLKFDVLNNFDVITTGDIELDASAGVITLKVGYGLNLMTPSVMSTSANSGQALALLNSTTGEVDFRNAAIGTLVPYADDTAAGVGGLISGQYYQTDGTGLTPLNAVGIVMIKQ